MAQDKEYMRVKQAEWYARQKNKGLIYVIEFPDGDTYVGSTTSCLQKRLNQHKCSGRSSMLAKDLGNCTILPLHYCTIGEDILEKEQEHINKLKPTLNILNARGKGKLNSD